MGKTKEDGVGSVAWSDSGKYPVKFVDGLFDDSNGALAELMGAAEAGQKPRFMLVADSNVVHRTEGLGTKIGKYLDSCGMELAGPPVVVGGGEKCKSDDMASVKRIMDAAVGARIGRNDVMLVLGGGAVQDVAGFAAAQVRGGVKLIRVPTTPAAMVESPFAQTAAINFSGIKNSLKVASRPYAVAIDLSFMTTVLDGVWRGGAGEILRYAAARDASLIKKIVKVKDKLAARDMAAMSALVRDCVASHMQNGDTSLAEWSALRMETMSNNRLPHGYAIPLALCIDCAYASEKGFMSQKEMALVCSTLADCGALDGLSHSLHILEQNENILYGLDAWRLSTGSEAVEIPSGIGKTVNESAPDRELYGKTIHDFLEASKDMWKKGE